jgi:hypothetical protein
MGQYTTAWKGYAAVVVGQVYTRDVTVVNDLRAGQSPALMAAQRIQVSRREP